MHGGSKTAAWIVLMILLLTLSSSAAAGTGTGEPAVEPMLRLETGMHTSMIGRISVDARERYLVTGSHDKTLRIWIYEPANC